MRLTWSLLVGANGGMSLLSASSRRAESTYVHATEFPLTRRDDVAPELAWAAIDRIITGERGAGNSGSRPAAS